MNKSEQPETPAKQKTLDEEILNTLRDIMEDDFGELVPAFIESSQQIARALHESQPQQDFETMRLNAHSLKSSSANIGALRLSSMARELEAQCKEGIAVDAGLLRNFDDELQRVERALTDYVGG